MDVIKAQSILIVPKQTSEPSVILSILALGRTLKENGKSISYYIDESISKSLNIFKDDENIINDTSSKNELTVKLDNIKSIVKNLDWEQNDDELTIKLTSKEGEIGSPDISITHTNQSFDLRIFIQIKKQDLENLPGSNNTSIFSGTGVYIPDESQEENTPLTVFNFIKKTKYKLTGSNAETLLLALRNYTDNFSKRATSEIFQIAAELMRISEKSKSENPVTEKGEETSSHTEPQKAGSDMLNKTPETQEKKKEVLKPDKKIEFATPEELPANYDPLSPATRLPEPMKLEPTQVPTPKVEANTPLPQAS